MIKILIVEDDKLARKGLVSIMPWDKYDMHIVGEASNGKSALSFLDENEVDLVITDISMPVMSGFEFICEAKLRYPKLMFVILTLHESFDYAQQAIRLDVLDYISKIQLEEENYDSILGNIYTRYLNKKADHGRLLDPEHDLIAAPACMVFVGIGNQERHADSKPLSQLLGEPPTEIGTNLWVYYERGKESEYDAKLHDFANRYSEQYILFKVTDLRGHSQSRFHHNLRKYNHNFLFSKSDAGIITISELEKRLNSIGSISQDEFSSLREKWNSVTWMSDRAQFDTLMLTLKQRHLSFPTLFKLLIQLETDLKNTYSFLLPADEISLPETFYSWEEVAAWFERIYQAANTSVSAQQLSPDVFQSILKAVRIIQSELDGEVFATTVSQRVNMSRSYFCLCFKKVVGQSFNQYLRNARIERAKNYLLKTDKSIQWIAGQTGYLDEKYFSKVFKSEVGLLPSVYRQHQSQCPSAQ